MRLIESVTAPASLPALPCQSSGAGASTKAGGAESRGTSHATHTLPSAHHHPPSPLCSLSLISSSSSSCTWPATKVAGRQRAIFVSSQRKMSTVVMRVDLECEKCYKKIRKVLCKVQDKVSIRTISYDEKNSTVTVSGPFDGEEVADRLTSDAGKVITDIHVIGGFGGFGLGGGGGGGKQKHGAAAAPGKAPKPGKANGNGHGQGQGHGNGGHGGGGGHGGLGGGGGGKTEKKHVKFDDMDMDMDDDDFDLDDMDEPAGRHAHSGHGHGNGGGKPKIIRTNTPIAARLEAPRTGPAMSMAAAAPVRMPMPAMGPMPQQQVQHAQGMGVPSIWPAAPELGYSTQPYGSYSGPPAGGYYGGGGPAAAYGPAGHWPYGGYGRNPYAQQQYYEEEPSAGCKVM